jgi:hypothetical protein
MCPTCFTFEAKLPFKTNKQQTNKQRNQPNQPTNQSDYQSKSVYSRGSGRIQGTGAGG